MKAIGIKPIFDIPAKNNPLPWTEHWLNSKGQQNAPQETEIESYVIGGIKQMSSQTPSQGLPSDHTWANRVYLDAARKVGMILWIRQIICSRFAEELWEMEKKKHVSSKNVTRHSVKVRLYKSGMTLITDPESDNT